MEILSPIKSEKLTISEYTKVMSDETLRANIIRTRYEINHDWNDVDTGYFFVEYDRPTLREKTI